MPDTPFHPTIDTLRRLAAGALAYAVAVAAVATALPAILMPSPVVRLLPEPPPVVARVPVTPPPAGPAPNSARLRS